jgi:DNA-directed RNA polymerase subunit beta
MAEDSSADYESALLKIYARLRPGNPPQKDKAEKLFAEKFYDENRYRLGKVGRFRINRKFDQNVPESVMTLRVEDIINSIKYIMLLRSGESSYEIDDIDHLGNRRLRTIDELAADEMRKGFLKLRRTVQERMSMKDPESLGRIAELVNSKSIWSSIEFFFGRGELSQVVDQTNPLSQLTHERRLSALGPGGLNRKRAGFEVRDVHISHYGRICPIETPEGTNIGLIASLSIYSHVDDYGFLLTPYRKVEKGKVNGGVVHLRADEEMRSILAPPDIVDPKSSKLHEGTQLARVNGDLASVDSKEVQYVDISPKQTVEVGAHLAREAAHGAVSPLAVVLRGAQVVQHQEAHLAAQSVFVAEELAALLELVEHARAHFGVAEEVDLAVGRDAAGLDLADVVEERAVAHLDARHALRHHLLGVLPDVLVAPLAVAEADHGLDLGLDGVEHTGREQ